MKEFNLPAKLESIPILTDAEENGGFTSGKPWFLVNPNYREINAESQTDDQIGRAHV